MLEEARIRRYFVITATFSGRSDYVAPGKVFSFRAGAVFHQLPQALALLLIVDAMGNTNMISFRHIDQIT